MGSFLKTTTGGGAAIASPTASQQLFVSTGAGAAATNAQWINAGTTGQTLTTNGAGNLVWATPVANTFYRLTDATAAGQIFVSNGAGDVHNSATSTAGGNKGSWLSLGTAGQSLTVNAGATGLAWATTTTLSNPSATGQMLIATSAGNINTNHAWITAPTPGQILGTSLAGTPRWINAPDLNSDNRLPDATAVNQIFFSNGAGDVGSTTKSIGTAGAGGKGSWLSPGTANQYLKMNAGATALEWATLPAGTTDTFYRLLDATASGQLFVSNGAGDVHASATSTAGGNKGSWLSLGTAGQTLTVNAGATGLTWVTPTVYGNTTLTNPSASQQLLLSTGAGNVNTNHSWLAPGTATQYLRINAAGTAVEWATLPSGTTDTFYRLPATTGIAQLLISTATGDPHSSTLSTTGGNASTWLAKGTANQVLAMNAGATAFAWTTPVADTFYRLPPTTALGQLFVASAVGDPHSSTLSTTGGNAGTWLARGTANQVLQVNAAGTNIQWATLATGGSTTLTNPTAANQMLIATGAGAVNTNHSWIAAPTAGQILGTNASGVPLWIAAPATNSDNRLPDATAANQLFFSNGSGDVGSIAKSIGAAGAGGKGSWLAAGTSLQYLRVNAAATALEWAALPAGSTDTFYRILDATAANQIFVSNGAGDVHASSTSTAGGNKGSWLSLGTAGQVLSVNAGATGFTWTTPTVYGNTTLTNPTASQQLLLSAGAGNVNTNHSWLAPGGTGTVLAINGSGNVAWTAIAPNTESKLPLATGTAQLLVTNGAGDVSSSTRSIGTGAGDKANWLAAGTAGQVLAVNAGATALTWVTPTVYGSTTLNNPTASQQLLLSTGAGNVSSNHSWLSQGTATQYLRVNAAGTALEWATLPSGTTDTFYRLPATTAVGQLLISNAVGDPHSSALSTTGGNASTWLARGTAGQVLQVNGAGTNLQWATLPTTPANAPDPSAAQQVLVSSASGAIASNTSWINAGTAGQVLTISGAGAVTWATPATGSANSDNRLPSATAANQIFYSNGAGDVGSTTKSVGTAGAADKGSWLAPGTANQVLAMNAGATAFGWVTAPVYGFTTLSNPTAANQMLLATGAGNVNTNHAWIAAPTAGQVLGTSGTGVPLWVAAPVNTDRRLPNATAPQQVLVSTAAGDVHSTSTSIGAGAGGNAVWENENDFLLRNLDGYSPNSAVTDFAGPDNTNYTGNAGLILGSQISFGALRQMQLFQKKTYQPMYATFALPLNAAGNVAITLGNGARRDLVALDTGFNASGDKGGTTPPNFLNSFIELPRAGKFLVTFGATIGVKMVATSLSIDPSNGSTLSNPRAYHLETIFSPCLSFKVDDNAGYVYEVRGTQTPLSLRENAVYYNEVDVSVITTATIITASAVRISPRMHWFSGFQANSLQIQMTATKSTSMFSSISEICRPQDYYGSV